jgi:ABC-type uncharacterized transport system permease subunit
LKKRLYYLALGIIVFLISYSIGAKVNIEKEQSSLIKEQFESKIEGINELGIFQNNVLIALSMFIPGIGVGIGVFSGFGTGLVFNAMALENTTLQNISPLAILLTPFGLMEIFSYGVAISRSGMLIYDLYKKNSWKLMLKYTIIEIVITVSILIVAAFIEWNMIKQLLEIPR